MNTSVDKFAGRTLVRQVTLPSKGKLYPDSTGVVKVAAVTTRQEKILAGSGNSAAAKLDMVLEQCIDTGGLATSDLLLADRLLCLFHIRSLSYGDKYGFMIKCPSCGKNNRHEVDLINDIPLTEADDNFVEPFPVTLPHSGQRLGLRIFRGKDESAVAAWVEKHGQNANPDDGDVAYFYRLARHISTINDKQIPIGSSEAMELVQKLEGPDSLALRNAIDKTSIGYQMVLNLRCKACGSEDEVSLPFSVEFFRPKS